MVICYIRAVSTSAQSGRMRMLSRVVSTTDPAAKCSSWPNCTANTEVMAAAGQHSSRSTTWADIPNRSRPSTAKAARQTAGMSSIRTANGIEVKIPTELLNSDSELEFLHDPDGSVSLLIKNVIL